ncbi:MAG: ATP-binding protein [Sediminibacterium sp.]|nr:ATP-binding protein [Sediminibacterium sp.]MBP6145212.1 ATP-binding protein [Sediminibacterium sp.]
MKQPSVELKLPIIPNMELIATQTAEVIARHMHLTEDQAGEISMALIEACINAFEHSKAENNVFIHFLIEEDSLVVKVIDQGIGFDKTKVEIPKIENKIGKEERKRGWGLQLIQELMDSVEFESNSEGTTVTMKKNINK